LEKPKKRWFAATGEAPGLEPSAPEVEASEVEASEVEASEVEAPQPAGRGFEREVISRKELARQLRRQAYQRAKAARAADPKHLALKEAAKQRRRELYRHVKEQRKSRDAERDAERKAADAKQRAEAKRQLAERVKSVIGPASEPGRALARDIDRALQSADVKELIEQLRAQSATLAAQHRDGIALDAVQGAAPLDDDSGV
jgi:hypothetical protein